MENYKIVIADDHPLIRQGLRKVLEGAEGLSVVGEAGDGVELLEMLTKSLPDLVVLDISMPEMRGIDALREIKSLYQDVKVLILTMHKEYLSQALASGADGYLLKDMEPEDLMRQLAEAARGKITISERLTQLLVASLRDKSRPTSVAEAGLTEQESRILEHLAEGKSNKLIARDLGIAEGTVKVHVKHLLKKLNLRSRVEAAVWADRCRRQAKP